MTDLLYLEDTYLFEGSSTLEEINKDDQGTYCILEKTVFYPQGGGQASDIGSIKSGDNEIHVSFVAYVNEKVRHYGDFESVVGSVGETATMKVDEGHRMVNAKSHTAGHLIQAAIEEIDPSLKAVKGFHFPVGSHVEFEGDSQFDNLERKEKANERLKELIAENIQTNTQMMSKDEIMEACPDLPYSLPEGKPLRVMAIGNNAPVPCGGTHVKSLSELGKVEITKMKKKKGRIKVSYSVA